MAGYPIGQVKDKATQGVLKQVFDQLGILERSLAALRATALVSGSPYEAGGNRISGVASPEALADAVNVAYLRAYVAAQLALAEGGSGAVEVDPAGALEPGPLAVRVDGSSVIINGANRLEAPGAAGGITTLTGDGTAGPGSGSVPFTLAASGVSAATYGDASNVPQFAVDAKGRVTSVTNVAITPAAGTKTAMVVFAFGSTVAVFDPADATTYIFGDRPALNPGTAAETLRVTMPKAGTAKVCYGIFPITGTLGSAGNSTLTLHNRTAVTAETISSTVALTANPTRFNNTAMTLAFSAGDELDISWLTPTWATNPTDVFGIVHLYVEFT